MDQPNTLTIDFVKPEDFAQWLPHWQSYQVFYKVNLSDAITQKTWERFFDEASPLHCIVARKGDEIIGFAHFLYHQSTWSTENYCYLEDLFVSPDHRGLHTGKALIEFLTEDAKQHNCSKVYWHTQETNHTAQRLYDWIATKPGMIKYDIQLHNN